MANLDKALAEYRALVSVEKRGHNPFFGNDYYQLDDVLNAIADSYEHGIYWGQYIVDNVLYTKLSTDTDERVSTHKLPEPTVDNHQKIASQVTYMKRIHLITMFGICEPDADGNTDAAPTSLAKGALGVAGNNSHPATPPSFSTKPNEL